MEHSHLNIPDFTATSPPPPGTVLFPSGSGGIVTLISFLLVALLVISEFVEYWTPRMEPSLVVETARKERLWIELNITFPHMPCILLGVDVMDVTGEQQNDVSSNMFKIRIDQLGMKIDEEKAKIGHEPIDEEKQKALVMLRKDANYCGSCYGATADNERGCCDTCESVKEAYSRKGWSFVPDNVDQCIAEGYVDELAIQQNEGCIIYGHLEVNRVAGNVHFAPGKSFQQSNMHVHDVMGFVAETNRFTKDDGDHKGTTLHFGHTVNRLAFGKSTPFRNPLDGAQKEGSEVTTMYQYFIKVVGTRYVFLNGTTTSTNQFSVTENVKSARAPEGAGMVGLPGVFFNYEISPMTVVYTQEQRSFGSFLTGVCAVVGGIFTVAGLVDGALFGANKLRTGKVDLGKGS
ncbi:Endoplasmic reticulum-Golgi intermediate compartment protein 3 [Gonapodya sp. JEL0774]|nr:Endoplasmic reticulum-Golgi intermediate compartment protein 3 [Gonapodya sp. JEL0774]